MKNEIETFITHSEKRSSEEIKNIFVDIFSHSYDLLSSCKKTITKIRECFVIPLHRYDFFLVSFVLRM